MRKNVLTIIVIVFLVLCSRLGYADGYGVKGGMNFANLTDIYNEDLKMWGINPGAKMGVIAGAFYRFDIGKSFAVQPELYYSQKGLKASGMMVPYGIRVDYDFKINLDYLEIPILFKYKIPVNKAITPCVFAGPYVAFKTRAAASLTLSAVGLTDTEEADLDEVKSVDFGFTVGTGASFNVGKDSFIIDLRYSLGLIEIADGVDSKNSVFSILFGYGFNKK